MAAVNPVADERLAVPLPRVATFVRQLTHDVRNTLNSLDLQAAYLLELTEDPEALEELKRMRGLIQSSARQLQGISSNFWSSAPSLIPYSAKILVEDFQDRLRRTLAEDAPRIRWDVQLGEEEGVEVDIEMLFGALSRIIENTFTFSAAEAMITAHVFTDEGRLVFDFGQPSPPLATDPQEWGREPFVTTRRGAYGLGLFRARSFITLQEGDLTFEHDSGRNLLLTRVSLPLAPLHESTPAPTDRHHR